MDLTCKANVHSRTQGVVHLACSHYPAKPNKLDVNLLSYSDDIHQPSVPHFNQLQTAKTSSHSFVVSNIDWNPIVFYATSIDITIYSKVQYFYLTSTPSTS